MPSDNGRSWILDRLSSRRTTIEEFNYDALQAPPLGMFLSPMDIAELHNIATSLRLSGKPKERYEAIDNVMRRRGLVKFGAGTNRVVYRHPEFNNILFKVAADDVGLGDNPAEFRNQMILKPFVAKTFEISPCGTVAVVERLKHLINREEYLSVADDVFELINTWIVGKYIMADIGSQFYMNIGIRKGFGVCLLDYPYLYELDGAKIFCNAPSENSPTGYCNGEIDYDDGFNFLRCKKCGAVYKARELAKNIETKTVLIKERGQEMIIKVKGGSRNINVESNKISQEEQYQQQMNVKMVRATPTRPAKTSGIVQGNSANVSLNVKTNKGNNNVVDAVNKMADISKEVVKTVNGISVNESKKEEPKVAAPVVEEAKTTIGVNDLTGKGIITVDNTVKPVEERPAVEENKEVKQGLIFGEKVKSDLDTKSTPVYDIERATNTIIESLPKIMLEDVKLNAIEKMFNKLIDSNIDKVLLGKLIIKILSKLGAEEDGITDLPEVEEFIKKFFALETVEEQEDNITAALQSIKKKKQIMSVNIHIEKSSKDDSADNDIENNKDVEGTTNITGGPFSGITWFSAKKINTRELVPGNKESYDAIAVYDSNGNYIGDNQNNLILIDEVDDYSMDDYTIVSKKWLEGVEAEGNIDNPFKEEEEEEDQKEAPVGSLPQSNNSTDSEMETAMQKFIEEEIKE